MDYSKKPSYPKNNRYRPKKRSEWGTILLFYVLPFLIVNAIIFYCATTRPKVEIAVADTNDYLSTEVTVTIQSWFPTKDVQFSMAGEALEAEKGKKRTYTIIVTKNGTVEATVTNINGMKIAQSEQVDVLDDIAPSIEKTDIEDGILTFTVSDSQSGVNFDSIYAKNSLDEQPVPLSIDRAKSTMSYEMDPKGLHVYVQDKAGNKKEYNFTSHKEGDVEHLEGSVEEAEHDEATSAQSDSTNTETSEAQTSEASDAQTSEAQTQESERRSTEARESSSKTSEIRIE